MDTVKPVVCIFPHGQKDFPSSKELVEFLKAELRKERQGKYRLRNLGNTRRFEGEKFIDAVTPHSLVLFKKVDRIWGTGAVQKGIEKVQPPEILPWGTYRFTVYFDPQMVVVYDRGVPVGAIEKATGVDLTSGFLKASYLVLGYRDEIEPKLRDIMDLPVKA